MRPTSSASSICSSLMRSSRSAAPKACACTSTRERVRCMASVTRQTTHAVKQNSTRLIRSASESSANDCSGGMNRKLHASADRDTLNNPPARPPAQAENITARKNGMNVACWSQPASSSRRPTATATLTKETTIAIEPRSAGRAARRSSPAKNRRCPAWYMGLDLSLISSPGTHCGHRNDSNRLRLLAFVEGLYARVMRSLDDRR